jgi:hypothetical protein
LLLLLLLISVIINLIIIYTIINEQLLPNNLNYIKNHFFPFRLGKKKKNTEQSLPLRKEVVETREDTTIETATCEDNQAPHKPAFSKSRQFKDSRKHRETRKTLRNTGKKYTTIKNKEIIY